jgi:uncharacterized protein (TIGR00255 family)
MTANNVTPGVRSMTGYALAESRPATLAEGLPLTLELRSVNNRFLDLALRMPDDLRCAETALREVLQAHVVRGKLEARLQVDYKGQPAKPVKPLTLNTEFARHVAQLAREVEGIAPNGAPLSVHELMRWPGVLQDDTSEEAGIAAEVWVTRVRELALQAVADFNASRQREGDKLKAMLQERIAGIEQWIARLGPLLPEATAAYRQKLVEKMAEAIADATRKQAGDSAPTVEALMDHERVRAEAALYAIKVDVAEELTRLSAHCAETRRLLDKPPKEGVGKRLDFLMQEFNREANTLGSKSVSLLFGEASVEMKVMIEQMREQVQNLE